MKDFSKEKVSQKRRETFDSLYSKIAALKWRIESLDSDRFSWEDRQKFEGFSEELLVIYEELMRMSQVYK